MLTPKECATYRDTIIDAFVRGPSYYYWSVRVATADQVRGEIAMHARIKAIEERARTSADCYKELLERTGKHCSEEAESLLIENNQLKEQIAFYESKYECAEEKERVLVEHTNSLAERLRLTSLSEEHLATEVEKLETRLQDQDITMQKIREVSMEEKQAFEDMVAHLSKNLVKAERKVRRLTEALDVQVKEANKMKVCFYKVSQEDEPKIFENDCQSGCEMLKSELDTRRESEVEVVTNSIEDKQILFEEAESVMQQSSFQEKCKADCQDMYLAFHSENVDIVTGAKDTINSPLLLEEQLNQYYQLNNHVKVPQEMDAQKLFDSRLSNMNSAHKVLGKAVEDSTMVKDHVEWNIQGHDILFDTYISTNSFSRSVNTKSAACISVEENQTRDDYETINSTNLLQSHIDMTLRELTKEQTSVLESLDLSGNKEQILEMLGKIPGLTKTQVNLLVDVACSLVT
jgi:CRISPR/Cas system CMR-associated protein Cmr5 small subunit